MRLVCSGEKLSGEQSQISWAYSQTVVKTNEIEELLIINSTSLKAFLSTRVSFLSGLAQMF